MLTHPIFTDLLLHTDDELSRLLDSGVVERETIHAWPLSCVQRLRLADGRQVIYKSQLPPTVEPEFYERASSRLLPGYRLLGKLGACHIMAIAWIEAPLLSDVAHDETELVAHGRRVMEQIGAIGGDLPIYLDLRSVAAWSGLVEAVLGKLRTLVLDGRFGRTDLDAARRVRAWATSGEVVRTVSERARLAHGDLLAEQVFVTADGYRVVDWQRPLLAPPAIDLVALLVSQGLEPRRHVAPAEVGIFWFLRLHWAVEAQHDLFPAFRGPLFDNWAAEAIGQIPAYSRPPSVSSAYRARITCNASSTCLVA